MSAFEGSQDESYGATQPASQPASQDEPEVWASLVFLKGNDNLPIDLPFETTQYTIGRSKKCDMRMQETWVGRQHCDLVREDDTEVN
jgi:pSer/pThr/pTyr-binding forkhead associated (FHA) protein